METPLFPCCHKGNGHLEYSIVVNDLAKMIGSCEYLLFRREFLVAKRKFLYLLGRTEKEGQRMSLRILNCRRCSQVGHTVWWQLWCYRRTKVVAYVEKERSTLHC